MKIASIAAIDAGDASFDGVLCSSVVEYADDLNDALLELNRVLKPGGKLILSIPNSNSPVRRVQKLIRRGGLAFGLDMFPYLGVSVNELSQGGLIRRLGDCGFVALALDGFDPVLPAALRKVLPAALHFVVAAKIPAKSGSK